ASPVATQLGGYMGMLDTYNNAFAHMDMYMLKPSTVRLAEQRQNQYAITESANVTYNGKPNEMNSKGVWVKPYASFDSVSLKDGPKADNFSYGSFIGGDSDMFKLKNGFYGVVSPYVAYQGSHQSYSGNSVYQNGGTVGVTGTFYKGNFFTGVTVGTGANISEASTMYGSEDFPMLMAGIANKTGYNFEFKNGRFIIQPNLQLSYTFVNTFDYTNGAGVRIESDPLHAIQVAPNVKFIMNTEGGWQPYATVGFRWNIMDETNFTAAETTLPEMSIKPYVNYGFGIQRTINDRLTAYGQIMLRHGGRNGIAANFGGRYMLGSESDPNANKHEL
ncbi:autotransporter outer membrane beta-barrel domain-containing protein, partial [bacterium]|nr:autotransporter outer membrane beta-barrel domain-containing protein [bacterium]